MGMVNRIVLGCILVLTASCLAEPKVSVGVESYDACVGESFVYQIRLSDTREQPNIRLPELPGCRVQTLPPSRNQSTNISIVNGRMKREERNEVLYNFKLTPLKEGELVIPAVSFKLGKEAYSTDAVTIRVSRENQITDIELELSVERPVCYVGQTIRAIWRLYLGRNASLVGFDLPLLNQSEFTVPNYMPKTSDDKEYVRVPVGDGKVAMGELRMENWKGTRVRCLEFSYPVRPMKSGVYELDAGSVVVQVEDKRARRASRSSFWDSMFDRVPAKEVSLTGNQLRLEVKELPPSPTGFSGLLGPCHVTSSATPLEVNVGDPIVLTVTVSGVEYPDNVKLPPFGGLKALQKGFRVSAEEPGAVKENGKVYQCTLRARDGKVKEIPALEFVYFDVEAGEYRTCCTQPISLTVNEVRQVTVADVQGTGAVPAALKESVKALDDGLAHNYSYKRGLDQGKTSGTSWYVWLLIVLGALFAGQLLFRLIGWVRSQNPEKRRRLQSLAEAKRSVEKASASQELYAGFQTYLQVLLELKPGDVSCAAVAAAMNALNRSAEVTASVQNLLKRYEEIQYSGSGTAEDLKQETLRVIQVLEQKK